MNKLFALVMLFFGFGLLTASEGNKHVDISVKTEKDIVAPGDSIWVAVIISPKKGYHTYWRNPGDSGLPTVIDWNLPEGIKIVEHKWEIPEKNIDGEITDFIYSEPHVQLYKLAVADNFPISDLKIEFRVEWLVCKTACFPGDKDMILKLKVSDKKPKLNKKFAAYFENIPQRLEEWGIGATKYSDKIEIRLTKPPGYSEKIRKIEFYPYTELVYDNSAKQNFTDEDGAIVIEIPLNKNFKDNFFNIQGIIVADEYLDAFKKYKAIEINTIFKTF